MAKKRAKKKVVKTEKAAKQAEVQTPPKVTPHPTAGPKVQEFEDLLDSHLAGDTGSPKRGPGRPPKEKPQEPEQPELTLDVVAGVVKIPFELWSISQSVKSLALTNDEAKRIAEPAQQLLEYYLPKIPVIAYAWIGLSVSSFWVMRTRLLLIQELKEQREKQQAKSPPPAVPAQPGVTTKFPQEIKPEKV